MQVQEILGQEGTQKVEAVIREQMIQAGALSWKVMRVDTAAMQKNIAYLTDNASLQKSRMRVLRLVWKAKGLVVKVPKTFRTFARVSRKAVLSMAKFGRDKMERVPKVPKKLVAMGAHPPGLPGFSREVRISLRRNALKAGSPVLVCIREALRAEARILERIMTQTKNHLLPSDKTTAPMIMR